MPALAANYIEIFGNTWNTSTYAKVVENKIETDGAGPDDFNIYWDAENAKLTLKDVDMDIENLSITADLENLQINLIGKNTFSVSKNINGDFYFISNTGKMSITGAQDALLDIDVTLNDNVMGNIGIISADGSITNSTSLDLLLSVPEESSFTAKLYCILSGWSRGSQGGLENSGTITAKTERMGLSGSSSNIYAIYIIGGPMHNTESGTLDLTGITTNGSIACLAGNYIPYESSWTNDGTILASATAYGGSYPGFTGSAFSNHACAISVYSNYDALMMTNNGYMDLYAVNYGQNKGYEYAIGMEFESSATNFINNGTIDIHALQGYTFGMYLPTLEEDSVLKNYGDISILVTTDGEFLSNVDNYASATGILLTLSNYDSNPEPKITNLSLEPGSSLEITARPADNNINEDMGYDDIYYNLCAAIQMQKIFVYGDPYGGEAPMEIILSDDLVIVEEDGEYDGGEPIALLESFYLPDFYLYINTIGNYFTEEESGDTFSVPSKHIQILPKIPGTTEISGNPKVGNEVTAKLSGVPGSIPVT